MRKKVLFVMILAAFACAGIASACADKSGGDDDRLVFHRFDLLAKHALFNAS